MSTCITYWRVNSWASRRIELIIYAEDWNPSFVDYFYVSFTNASAFSPTDTMPLTAWAKVLMMIQSLASLLTIGLVAARTVNIMN